MESSNDTTVREVGLGPMVAVNQNHSGIFWLPVGLRSLVTFVIATFRTFRAGIRTTKNLHPCRGKMGTETRIHQEGSRDLLIDHHHIYSSSTLHLTRRSVDNQREVAFEFGNALCIHLYFRPCYFRFYKHLLFRWTL
jgi:hypothetical protein